MKRSPITCLALLLVCNLLFTSGIFPSRDLRLEKSPYLILNQHGEQVVRVHASQKPSSPIFIEFEKTDGTTGRLEMNHLEHNLLEHVIPSSTLRYRLHVEKTIQPWNELRPPGKKRFSRFISYGDNRYGKGSEETHRRLVTRIAKENADALLHSGDLVGWGGKEHLWNGLLSDLNDVTSRTPIVAAVGNHDLGPNDPVQKYFRAHNDKAYMGVPLRHGRVIVLDSNLAITGSDKQTAFLRDELREHQNVSPLIVLFHHPPLNAGKHIPDQNMLKHWVPLFEEFGVDLVLTGHDHNYQRFTPINGVTYVVTGGGGAPLYPIKPHPDLRASKDAYHYVVLDINENTIRGSMRDVRGIEEDTFTIVHQKAPVPRNERRPVPFRKERFWKSQ